MFRRTAAVAATAAVSIGLAAAPASALAWADWSDEESGEAQAVVRLQIAVDNEGGAAACTGTAIAPQWVVTAHHCVEDTDTFAGNVLVGQGEDPARFQINHWEVAPVGDVALIHVTEDMGLSYYPEIATTNPAPETEARVYGWSPLGQGQFDYLPTDTVTVRDNVNQPEFGDGLGYLTQSELPTKLQQGDSGGPLFVDGKIAGVLSMGISGSILVPVTSSGYFIHAATTPQKDWIQNTIATNPTQPATDVPVAPNQALIPVPLKEWFPRGLNPRTYFGELPVGSSDIVDIIQGSVPAGE
ncbi:S1 family peptidase [Corynebacterium sp. TAE3-ERU12]|uniref:trypsin-like serine protease n=1 Tax=Corynebacterium sp. TAE3-ERU12 TaxID=2849491 RepID=UPI001C453DBA|nr:trypsin-like serine protease [Corynebacterium sp. TAE3-ERU12]MBV7294565.1 S1 family peptidase [Corynebacterium sp. TAE3-ERU12]